MTCPSRKHIGSLFKARFETGNTGYAFAVTDRERGFGAVIGKALSPLEERTGLVLVLVNLQ